jgi:hypothetical protein
LIQSITKRCPWSSKTCRRQASASNASTRCATSLPVARKIGYRWWPRKGMSPPAPLGATFSGITGSQVPPRRESGAGGIPGRGWRAARIVERTKARSWQLRAFMGQRGCAAHSVDVPGRMRPVGDGVQFFDLVEDNWSSDRVRASSAAPNSGSTGVAIAATCTAVRYAASWAGRRRPAGRARSTGPATRGGPITGTTSAPLGLGSGMAAWGIMVPKS